MLELIYVEKIIKFYLDLIAGSKGLRGSSQNFEIFFINEPILLKFSHNM